MPRLVDAGRMGQAAKLYNEIADLLEAEGLTEQAIVNFEKAADMFSAENTATAAQKCMIKIGHLCASKDAPEFARAAEIFTRVATESMSNPLLKFQARGLLFEAFLCTLAQADVVAADAALSRSKDIDYTFPGSRECKLCEDILQAFKDMNGDAFTDAVFNYDQISKLDPWKTKCVPEAAAVSPLLMAQGLEAGALMLPAASQAVRRCCGFASSLEPLPFSSTFCLLLSLCSVLLRIKMAINGGGMGGGGGGAMGGAGSGGAMGGAGGGLDIT